METRRPYNLYCVGGDVKPCSINQSTLMERSVPGVRRCRQRAGECPHSRCHTYMQISKVVVW